MSNKDNKKPSWLHPIARMEYNGAMKTYKEIQARILPKEMVQEFDVEVPTSWTEQPALYLLRGLGYGKGLPKGSGVGLVQSPYADIYTKVYGVEPLRDLPLYRQMYRSQPDIMNAVQLQANLSVGKGFTIGHKDPKVVEYLTKKCIELNLTPHMFVMATDMLVYGNSYTEIQWSKTIEKKEQMYDFNGSHYTKNDLDELGIDLNKTKNAVVTGSNNSQQNFVANTITKDPEADDIVALKDLDPLYMRVRRDSYGNQYGYIQWLGFPPVLIDNESCIHSRYRPASWGYESAYGTSILMPIIKINDLLLQFENDAATWVHSRAVPPLIVKGGSPEKPYSTAQMNDLMGALKVRTAATMIFTKGDVTFEEFKTIASELHLEWWLNYLLLRRYQSLGVPPILMGQTLGGARGVAEVLLHDFVARLQVLQEFVADPIEQYIFKPLIARKFGKDVENAQIVWKPIVEEDANMRSQRLIQMLQAGAISINECRSEMGFSIVAEEKYDKLQPIEAPTAAGGFGKGGGSATPSNPSQRAPTENKKVNQQTKNPPEGHMKMEDIKTRRVQLMQLEEGFRTKMMELTQKAKFELKDGARLTKDVTSEASTEANRIINENVVASYLIGRWNANAAVGKEDDLGLDQNDLRHVAQLKDKCVEDFEKILNDMVVAKEEGTLE